MTVDKALVQDVIDRILKYGFEYEKELRQLNEKFEMKYTVYNNIRRYESNGFKEEATIGGADSDIRKS